MNRKIQIIASLILIIVLLGTQISYAISTNEKEEFFEVSSTEVAKKETLEMTFNLDKIEYDNFKILLNSNMDEIVVLDNGKIDGIGTHEELLENNEIYKEVYYSQNGLGGAENQDGK